MVKDDNIVIEQSNIAGVSGEYLIEVVKPDGTSEFPFGITKRKNLILDTFFKAILNGYKYGIQSFVQVCRVGDGILAPLRTDIDLGGNLIKQTYASDNFTITVNTDNNSVSLYRNFSFDVVTVPDETYSECIIGGLGINNFPEILTSRFVFPGELTLVEGDRLKVHYTLILYIPYLNSNVPVSLTGTGLDFTGHIRLSSNLTGIISQLSGDKTYIPLGDSNTTIFRDFKTNSNEFQITEEFANYGRFQSIFGIAPWANNIGFYPSGTHEPVNFPTGRSNYTPVGPKAIVTTGQTFLNDTGAYLDVNYYFTQDTANRQVGGIYLWHHNSGSSYAAIYYKFNTPQLISGNIPVGINLRWSFTRI